MGRQRQRLRRPHVTNQAIPLNTLDNLLNPYNVQAVPADKTAVVSWKPPTLSFFPVSLLTTYTVTVYQSPPGGGNSGGTLVTPGPPSTSGAGPCATGSASDARIVTSPPSPCQVIGSLTNGTSYYFVVTASLLNVLQIGVSAPSPAITPAGRPFPPTITNVVNSSTAGGAATVTWTPPPTQPDGITPGNNGSPITSYTLTATPATGANPNATTQSVTYTVPNPPPANYTATIPGLLNASPYNVTVTATNGIGTSVATAPSLFTPRGVPSAPTNVTATAGNGQALVSWNSPTAQANGVPDDNGSPITKYTIIATPSSGAIVRNDVILQSAEPTNCRCVYTNVAIHNLLNGLAYTITVTASNAVGPSLPSASTAAITPAGPPSTPTNVSAVAGDAVATIAWGMSSGNGAPVVYRVTATPGNASATTTSTQATITGLTNGTTYTFTVVATNRIGSSPASAPSNSVTPSSPAPPPPPPPPPGQIVTVVAPAPDADVQAFENAILNGGVRPGQYTDLQLQSFLAHGGVVAWLLENRILPSVDTFDQPCTGPNGIGVVPCAEGVNRGYDYGAIFSDWFNTEVLPAAIITLTVGTAAFWVADNYIAVDPNADIGEVVAKSEAMSNAARVYQQFATGMPPNTVYMYNGVAFDGYEAPNLLDAKGPSYDRLLTPPAPGNSQYPYQGVVDGRFAPRTVNLPQRTEYRSSGEF